MSSAPNIGRIAETLWDSEDRGSRLAEGGFFFPNSQLADHDPLDSYLRDRVARDDGTDLRNLIGKMRVISIGCHLNTQLTNFAGQIFGDVEIHRVDVDDLRGLSGQFGPYNIIIVLFNDPKRAKRVLRGLEALTSTKLCIAVTSISTPRVRADLLRSLFDEVIDKKWDPEEARLKIKSIYFRSCIYGERIENDWKFANFLRTQMVVSSKRSQLSLLYILFQNLNRVVKFQDLASYDFHEESYRINSLKVRVYYLRKKLKGYTISSVRGVGYRLTRDLE